jgi:hypothetical protein
VSNRLHTRNCSLGSISELDFQKVIPETGRREVTAT